MDCFSFEILLSSMLTLPENVLTAEFAPTREDSVQIQLLTLSSDVDAYQLCLKFLADCSSCSS